LHTSGNVVQQSSSQAWCCCWWTNDTNIRLGGKTCVHSEDIYHVEDLVETLQHKKFSFSNEIDAMTKELELTAMAMHNYINYSQL